MSHLTNIRLKENLGIYKTLVKNNLVSKSMVPAKSVVINEPFESFTIIGLIIFKQLKKILKKQTWSVALVSRMKESSLTLMEKLPIISI